MNKMKGKLFAQVILLATLPLFFSCKQTADECAYDSLSRRYVEEISQQANSKSGAKEIREWVEHYWDSVPDWNISYYNHTSARINVYKKEIGVSAFYSLRRYNGHLALGVLHGVMMDEFAKTNCQKRIVDICYNDLVRIKGDKNNDIDQEDYTKQCEDTYKLYSRILAFGDRIFALSPEFDYKKGCYNSFDTHKEKVKKERDDLKKHTCYSRLENIADVKNAIGSVESKLAKEERGYPEKVAKAIMSVFDKLDYTAENLKYYKSATNNASESVNELLYDHYKSFEERVNKRES